MTSFSTNTVQVCIKLRDELHDILKCNYCNKLLKSARTLNCSHHVCESCAFKQSTNEGSCIHCHCCYFTKDIINNISINNIIDTFHDLSTNISRAAKLFNISSNDKDEMEQDEDEEQQEGEEEEKEDEDEDDDIRMTKKRKRKSLFDANNQEMDAPKPKKRKLNNNNKQLAYTPDSAMIDAMQEKTNKSLNRNKSLLRERDNIFIPSEICMTGYDKEKTSLFESYANSLNITLNKKWRIGSTQMLISKSNIFDGTPNVTFKVLASILCGIPVVKESYLEDSYENNKVLNYKKYICNYQRVENNKGLFKGLDILFATTNMPTARLKTLLTLGKANILETREQIDNKNKHDFKKRVMICSHDTQWHQAKKLSKDYNCRVISESWVIKCIYAEDINNHLTYHKKTPVLDCYNMEPIVERIDFEEFDKTIKAWDDEESSDDDDDEDSDEDSDGDSV